MTEIGWDVSGTDNRCEKDAELRARLNEELGFYPARLDPESIAEYRREDTEESERYARYIRRYGGPGGSHYNQFRHIVKRSRA